MNWLNKKLMTILQMALKSRGPITIDPGKNEKKRYFPWIRAQLLNFKTARGKLKIATSIEKTAPFWKHYSLSSFHGFSSKKTVLGQLPPLPLRCIFECRYHYCCNNSPARSLRYLEARPHGIRWFYKSQRKATSTGGVNKQQRETKGETVVFLQHALDFVFSSSSRAPSSAATAP
jgi:hypothetical protein